MTFSWQLSNSLTFPGFPDKWPPCKLTEGKQPRELCQPGVRGILSWLWENEKISALMGTENLATRVSSYD